MARRETEKGARDGREGILLYGGAFNPPHIGHLRLMIEAREKMRGIVDRAEFLPVNAPPHKDQRSLLPFDFRTRLLRECAAPYPWLGCCEIERERPGLSYTYDTLALYGEKYPERRIFFLLGGADFLLLPTWRKGLELLDVANLVVAPRGDADYGKIAGFAGKMKGFRGLIRAGDPLPDDGPNSIIYLPAPVLNISSSRIREKWLNNENIAWLTPDPALKELERAKDTVKEYWQE